jgi:RNA polymerase sigma-70 factor (ECF subfamily)
MGDAAGVIRIDSAVSMDPDLIVRVQAGDRRAFDDMALEDYPRLYRVAQGILRDRHHAEDATQQAYLDIWRNIRGLRDPSKYEAWSYRLLVRACYAEYRRTPRWLPDSALPPGSGPVTGDALSAVLQRDELERGFRSLSMDHRAVLVLHFLLDMTLDQVAEALGVPRGTVYSRLSRAMESMRKAMGVPATGSASRQEVAP